MNQKALQNLAEIIAKTVKEHVNKRLAEFELDAQSAIEYSKAIKLLNARISELERKAKVKA